MKKLLTIINGFFHKIFQVLELYSQVVLLAIVLVWLGQLAGVVPSEPDTPVLSLFTVRRLGELLDSLPV